MISITAFSKVVRDKIKVEKDLRAYKAQNEIFKQDIVKLQAENEELKATINVLVENLKV